MSAGSNSSGNQKNSLAQRAERSARRVNDHAVGEEPFHEKGPVSGAFGVMGSDPEAVFKDNNPDVPPVGGGDPNPGGDSLA